MPRKRLTREESREQTRQRLLDAAAVMIAKKGLSATSVEDIAENAGYTRGAFYSNFNSKTDLFIELLRLDHQNIQEDLQKLLDADLSVEDLQKQLALFYAQCYRDDNNYVIWAEARLQALRDTKFRQRMNALCLEKRDMIAYFIEQFCKRMNMSLPGPAGDYALATIALMDGMLYFNIIMPNELPDASAESVLSTMFSKTFFGSLPA
ncbi:TetR/AcrR family transcriptional regulator [Dyella mobilis]|uniref:TetR family transcriptional regulator n=1 Tax=Dyella mobilis TaxID=1849582 RepID=A0ABS2KMI4_9GAMM|nr:TetR family transcriptional regulator [Dyella mobilis]MBM7132369.1 TetR family transcriptional regulator [Dyella mobilis]GLQ95643.1 TetR family transcriptional regulator [Dyella mobilis]